MKSKQHLVLCFALIAASLAIAWRAFYETVTLAWQNDKYTHILLIPPLSVLMIVAEKRLFREQDSSWALRQGIPLMLAATVIASSSWIWSSLLTADMLLALRMFALVLFWIGSFVLCFGLRLSRQLIVPLLFLFGLVPLPKVLLESIVALLQIGSAWSAHGLFAAFGVPVFQQGVLLTIPGLIVQVAQECSSIRSSSMLFVTAMVMAEILLRSFWRKAFIVALAIPLSVLKNGLRIFVIAMLGTRVDPGYLTGRLHHQGGVLFFAIALAITIVSIWMLRKGQNLAPSSRLSPVDAPATKKMIAR